MTWQEEFDKEFYLENGALVSSSGIGYGSVHPNAFPAEVKRFISNILTSLADQMDGVVGEDVLLHIEEKRGDNIGVDEQWGNGYNQAKSEVREAMANVRKEWGV